MPRSFNAAKIKFFGVPKISLLPNQWGRPCPCALDTRRTEHWRSMYRKSNGNPLLLHVFFFFPTRFSHMKIKKDSLLFFLMPCLYFQNHECKKKTRNSRGKTRPMENHFYTMDFFFLSLDFPYEHSERLPTIFFMPCQYFQKNECKKKLEIREGRQDQWKTTSTPWIFFFFHQIFPMNIQKGYLLFFLCPVSTSRRMNAKKNSKFEREDKSNGKPFLHNGFFFSFSSFTQILSLFGKF